MFLELIGKTERHLRTSVLNQFGVELELLTTENPPRIELGDLAFPFPFELAKTLKRPPVQIANELVDKIEVPDYIERFTAAGAGYVNVFFKRVEFARHLYTWLRNPPPEPGGEKIIVEHTNINPNKAAHIGHLRNAVLGDTFVRFLRMTGRRVEVQNYIDNTGVQVADVVVGFRYLRKMSVEEVKSIEDPFDYYCWDLYAEVSNWYKQDESHLHYREQILKEIEDAKDPTNQLTEYISNRIVLAHLRTMLRIGVLYEVLPRESEILHLEFWEDAFEQLKNKKAILYRKEGPHKGCWVLRLSEENGRPAGEKIIVRSNGTVTYVGKDIAYQLWKFGLLGKNFHYHPRWRYENGQIVSHDGLTPDNHTIWLTSTKPSLHTQPEFGQGTRVYNVIDVRQSYLQQVVTEGLRRLSFTDQADQSVHFSYEMVALSPKCCSELGLELSEEESTKPFVEVSGRKGLGVKADDLISKLVEKSLAEVNTRQPDLSLEKREQIANQIAVGALRYFLLKYTRTSIIAFDFTEALSFEGETGPYLQYSVVRARNIFRKVQDQDPQWNTSAWTRSLDRMWADSDSVTELIGDNEVWELFLQIARLDDSLQHCIRTLEVSHLAKQAFNLAQQFNVFYHKHHILSEKDPLRKCFYLTVTDAAQKGLLKTLALLGIQVPERM